MISRSSWTLNFDVLMVRSASARMGASLLALRSDALLIGTIGAQRMRPARLAEAAHERVVVGFQEEQPGGDAAADAARR